MNRTEKLVDHWLRHRNVLVELVDHVKDEDLDFKPWKGSMSLGELVLHIIYWNDTFVSLVKTGQYAEPAIPNMATSDELRSAVERVTRETTEKFQSLTDKELSAEVAFGPVNTTGSGLLRMMCDHEVHHKGQLLVYLRILGAEQLPFFIKN